MPDRNEEAIYENCSYRGPKGGKLFCHAQPPQMTIQHGITQAVWRWPETSPESWCGNHPDAFPGPPG